MIRFTHSTGILLWIAVVISAVAYFILGDMFFLLLAEILGVINIIISPLSLHSAMKGEFIFCELLVLFNLPIIFIRYGKEIISCSEAIVFVALYLVLSNISQMCLLVVSFFVRYHLKQEGCSDA